MFPLKQFMQGLECAIFKDKYPYIKNSINWTNYKFSSFKKKEQVSIKSVENVYKIVKK